METTQLYIELIIIGLETFGWISIFIINIIGKEVISKFSDILNNFSSSLLLIGILYIAGILVDRVADMIFQKGEDKIRTASGLKAKSSFLVWKENDAQKYSDYARSKIRILRASIINIPLIMVGMMWYTLKYYREPNNITVFLLILGIIFTCVSWQSYKLSLQRFYDRASALEKSKEEADKRKKKMDFNNY